MRRVKCKIALLVTTVVILVLCSFHSEIKEYCEEFSDLKTSFYEYDLNKKLNPFTVKLRISIPHLCQGKPVPYLFIMIPSATENFDKRAVIRSTWKTYGNDDNLLHTFGHRVVIAFLLGSSASEDVSDLIRKKSDNYSDIIQGDFEDIYNNLLTKMLMGFNWKIQYCPKANFLVKIDDDAYLDIPNLIRYLQLKESKLYDHPIQNHRRIYGYVLKAKGVKRYGKYAVTCKENPFAEYDDFMSGNCYVVQSELVTELFKLSEYFPYYYLDDVHITGRLRVVLGAELIHNFDFTTFFKLEEPCTFHFYKRISRTSVNVTTMNQLWSIHQNKTICTAPSYLSRFNHWLLADRRYDGY